MKLEQLNELCKKLTRNRAESNAIAAEYGVDELITDALRRLLGLTNDCQRNKLTPKDRKWILEHRKANPRAALKFYADKFNVTISAIFYLLKGNGIKSELAADRRWTNIQVNSLKNLVAKGWTDKQIGERLGKSSACISQARQRILRIKKDRGRKKSK